MSTSENLVKIPHGRHNGKWVGSYRNDALNELHHKEIFDHIIAECDTLDDVAEYLTGLGYTEIKKEKGSRHFHKGIDLFETYMFHRKELTVLLKYTNITDSRKLVRFWNSFDHFMFDGG